MLFDNESASPRCQLSRTAPSRRSTILGRGRGKVHPQAGAHGSGLGPSKHLLFSPDNIPREQKPRLKFREKLQSPLHIATANSQVVAADIL